MQFTDNSFLFLFLPLTVVTVWILRRWQGFNAAMYGLILASCVFYAYAQLQFLPLLFLSAIFNYGLSTNIYDRRIKNQRQVSKSLFILGLLANSALLLFFKYHGFFLDSLQYFIKEPAGVTEIIFPLGISFYTFKNISFLIDSFQGEGVKYTFAEYLLFIFFFAQMPAGPISNHKNFIEDLRTETSLSSTPLNLALGCSIITCGLFKKIVIADTILTPYTNIVFNAASENIKLTLLESWCGAIAYTEQIYFDFSGYSDLVVGIGLLFGMRLPINFNSPFKSQSIMEFWKRWHISLSEFIFAYLYSPLALYLARFSRNGPYLALFLAMTIMGVWHGSGWKFAIFGALHGSLVVLNYLWRKVKLRKKCIRLPFWPIFAQMLTLIAIVFTMVFVRANDLNAAWSIIQGMLGVNGLAVPIHFVQIWGPQGQLFLEKLPLMIVPKADNYTFYFRGITEIIILSGLFSMTLLLPNVYQWCSRFQTAFLGQTKLDPEKKWWTILQWRPRGYWGLILAIILFITLLNNHQENSSFIYNQF